MQPNDLNQGMFEIENVDNDYYRLWGEGIHIGNFEIWDDEWVFDVLDCITQHTNPNIFSFILKTLENLNNGVVYE